MIKHSLIIKLCLSMILFVSYTVNTNNFIYASGNTQAVTIDKDKVTKFIDDVKKQVIKEGITKSAEIKSLINKVSKSKGIALSVNQINQFTDILKKIATLNVELHDKQNQLNNFSQSLSNDISTTKGIIGNIQSVLSSVKKVLNDTIKSINDQLENLINSMPKPSK